MLRIEESKILIVDDLPENLLALEHVLQDLDCRILKAGSGLEALRVVRKHHFALVLLDVQMPGMDGFETATLLRSTKKTEHIPIMFVTALSYEQKYVFKGYETGAVDYLFKPIDPDILRSKVKVFLMLYQNTMLLTQQKQALEKEIARRRQVEEELRDAKEAAESANQAKSIFLANMSHELRTPLNAILGFSQILARSSHAFEQQEHLDIILRNGEHLLTLIDQVLDLSKIEAGRITLSEKNFDLHQMLEELESIFSFKTQKKGLELFVDRHDDLPQYISADEVKLRQILINLLSNAVKFAERGWVKLGVMKVADEIDVGGEERQSPPKTLVTLRFSIEDSGPGIASEEMEHLFEPFTQTGTGRQAREGTGLGLSICRKFVQLMGGDIRVESRPGHGTDFYFDIQVASVEHSTRNSQDSNRGKRVMALAPGEPRYRILIADGAPDNRKIFVSLLEPLGFELREAQDGKEALEIWEEWQPHLIWMDLRLPGMDGFEVALRIRELSSHPPVPSSQSPAPSSQFPAPSSQLPAPSSQLPVIIALSASVFDEDRLAEISASCDEFLRKPFREREIFDILARRLDIQFVYEDMEAQPQHSELTAEMLASLPKELYTKLQREVTIADFIKALKLVEEVREQDETLADGLTELLENYRFDRLQKLFPVSE